MTTYYPIVYSPGLSGTWIAWFINQHVSFPRYELEYCVSGKYTDDVTLANDCGCKWATWDVGSESIAENEQRLARGAKNRRFRKRALRLRPYHEITNEQVDVVTQFIIPELKEYNPIIITCNDEEHQRIVAKRQRVLFNPSLTDDEQYTMLQNDISAINNHRYEEIKKLSHAYTVVDIGKLIFDLDNLEYENILEFTQSHKINRWQDSILEMQNIIYKRFT